MTHILFKSAWLCMKRRPFEYKKKLSKVFPSNYKYISIVLHCNARF